MVEGYYNIARKVWRQIQRSTICGEDAIQEGVVACWLAESDFDPALGNFWSFMVKVAKRAMVAHCRTRRNMQGWGRAHSLEVDENMGPTHCNRRVFLSSHLSKRRRESLAREAKETRDDEIRRLMGLGLGCAEIGRRVGMSPSGAWRVVQRLSQSETSTNP